MRDIKATENTIEINDGHCGDVHVLKYRNPTRQEMTAYQARLFERKGKKMIPRFFEARVEFGRKLLTGFVKGTLGYEGKAFASDPSDPDYRADWCDLLVECAPDIVAVVAQQAFEATGVARQDIDIAAYDETDDPLAP